MLFVLHPLPPTLPTEPQCAIPDILENKFLFLYSSKALSKSFSQLAVDHTVVIPGCMPPSTLPHPLIAPNGSLKF